MKFFTDDEEIATVKADQITTHKCYNASLEVAKKKEKKQEAQHPSSSKVMLIGLNVQGRQEAKRPEPDKELKEIQIGLEDFQTTRISKSLSFPLKEKLVDFLRENVELFAWTAIDLLGIDPEFMNHRLAIFPTSALYPKKEER